MDNQIKRAKAITMFFFFVRRRNKDERSTKEHNNSKYNSYCFLFFYFSVYPVYNYTAREANIRDHMGYRTKLHRNH